MSFRNVLRLALTMSLVAVLAWSSDSGKSITVKGYVLDSACAFTKGLKKRSAPNVPPHAPKPGLRW